MIRYFAEGTDCTIQEIYWWVCLHRLELKVIDFTFFNQWAWSEEGMSTHINTALHKKGGMAFDFASKVHCLIFRWQKRSYWIVTLFLNGHTQLRVGRIWTDWVYKMVCVVCSDLHVYNWLHIRNNLSGELVGSGLTGYTKWFVWFVVTYMCITDYIYEIICRELWPIKSGPCTMGQEKHLQLGHSKATGLIPLVAWNKVYC